MAQLMPLTLASVKSRLVLPFWYRLTRVVPEKGQLGGCVIITKGDDERAWQLPLFQQTRSPSQLAWSDGWRPIGAQSAFMKCFGHDDNTINIIKVITVIVIIIECSLPYSNSALATASLFARLSSVSVPRPRRRSSCKQHNAIYFHCSAITLTAMSALHMYRIHNLQVTSHLRLKMGRCANEKVTCIVTNGQNSSTLGHCRLSATMNEVTAVSILLCSQG